MAFLRASTDREAPLVLRGAGVVLRPPSLQDYAAWAELRALSRQHLTPFEPEWADDELTKAAFRRRLRRHAQDRLDDTGYAFFVYADDSEGSLGQRLGGQLLGGQLLGGQLLGGLTLSYVRRGVAQTASLGYWVGVPHAGRGVMTSAVATVLPFAFGPLQLHRIEAGCLPGNTASIRVLEKSGFRREGLARRYLRINGEWLDHVLYGLIEDDIVGRGRRGA